jgi:hypothetical protein
LQQAAAEKKEFAVIKADRPIFVQKVFDIRWLKCYKITDSQVDRFWAD